MNQFRRFMYGRYGFDQFTRALVIASLLLSVITTIFRVTWLMPVTYIPIIYACFRIGSKNIAKRNQENIQYCRIMNVIRGKFTQLKLTTMGTKSHIYFRCSHCKQTIRVPRGKGKICITCPKCKAEFVKRT